MLLREKTNNSSARIHIKRAKYTRIFGTGALCSLVLLLLLMAFPISLHDDDAQGAPGVPEIPTLTMVTGQEKASVDVTPTSSTGSFAVSTGTDIASFSVTTSNYTGYTLSIKASDDAGQLINTDTSATLDSITTATDANTFATGATATYTNKWGYQPSKFCPDGTSSTCAANTDFLPAPTTTATIIDQTTTKNPTTANDYTIAIGTRVDYTKPSGTYTNNYTITAVANPIAYVVKYYDLQYTGGTADDANIIWDSPDTGSTANNATFHEIDYDSDATNVSTTIAITPPTTMTRNTYTFAGWCRNSTNQATVGVNKTVTAMDTSGIRPASATTKVTAYNNPATMCNGAVPDYTTSTDHFIKAGDTTLKLDPTLDNTNVILTAVWKPTTFATAGIAANANMQTMTSTICSKVTPNQFTTMTDSRDSGANSYTIIKLMDGKCWMADNLNFDAYTYKNNITTATTHATGTVGSTAITRFKTTTATTTDRYATSAINSNTTYASSGNWTASSSYSDPLINKSGKCDPNLNGSYQCLSPYQNATYTTTKVIDKYGTPASDTSGTADITYNFGPGGYKIGIYYNYCAATVGSYCYGNGTSAGTPSGDATEADICPANWKLPVGGASGDYQNLYTKISAITTAQNTATNSLSLQSMLSTPVSGFFHNATVYRMGTFGSFWSSSYASATDMGDMVLSGVAVSLQLHNYRRYGYSVRCVAQ